MNTEEFSIPDSIDEVSKKSSLDEYTKKTILEEEKAIHEEHEKKIKNIKRNTFIFGTIGAFIFLLSLGVYIVPKYFELQDVKSSIKETEQKIDSVTLQNITNRQTLKDLQIKQTKLEKKFGDIFPIILPEIKSKSEYQSAINRLAMFFEDFALYYNKSSSPLELPSINFGRPKEKGDVFVVPIQMTIKASEKNFNIFIDEVNKRSGSLDPKDFYLSSLTKKKSPIPVMSIDSLNVSLPKKEKSSLKFFTSQNFKKEKVNTLNFSVSLSAYFKATDEMKEIFSNKKKKK